jgi:UDP-N-acetylglucosamine acyltransferase
LPSAGSSLHPTAVIDPGALIEEGADIGPYAIIGPEVTIRAGARIGPHAVLEYAEIGPDCQVFPGACVGTAPQDTGYKNQKSRVFIGAGTVLREYVTVHRSKFEGGETRVGARCMLMAYSHVAHDCRLGDAVIMANGTCLGGHIEVGDGAFISGLVAAHQYVRIGRLVMVSGGSIITQDIPPFCTAQGDRAELYGLNLVGLKRAGIPLKSITALKTAYKTIFVSGLTLRDALAELEPASDPRVQEFLEFLKTSKRGFCRPPRQETP